jgi:hypothetical protein
MSRQQERHHEGEGAIESQAECFTDFASCEDLQRVTVAGEQVVRSRDVEVLPDSGERTSANRNRGSVEICSRTPNACDNPGRVSDRRIELTAEQLRIVQGFAARKWRTLTPAARRQTDPDEIVQLMVLQFLGPRQHVLAKRISLTKSVLSFVFWDALRCVYGRTTGGKPSGRRLESMAKSRWASLETLVESDSGFSRGLTLAGAVRFANTSTCLSPEDWPAAAELLKGEDPRTVEIVRLHCACGSTFAEVAEQLGLSQARVSQLFSQFKSRLRDRIEGEGRSVRGMA